MKKIITTILISLTALTIFAAGHTVTITSANVSCFGGSNGTATASVSGGVGPFSYSWSNGATVATNLNLVAGSYTCTVTDNNDLSTATSAVSINEPTAAITTSISHTDVSCGAANGTATVSANGGTVPYTYSWSNGVSIMSTITALAAGSYSVTVTDVNGCTRTDVAAVNNLSPPPLMVSTTPITCNGGNNGTASVTANGGTGPYTYSWSNGANGTTLASGLGAGTYAVTVADANGCMSVSTVVITEPTAIVVTTTASNPTCGLMNGGATVSANGGTGTLSYSWMTGSTGATASGLSPGVYTVYVTDANGCTSASTVVISNTPSPNVFVTTTDATCGQSNGSVTVTGNGGTGTLTYFWSFGSVQPTASNLSAGSYTVTVSDSKGCTATSIATISDTGAPNVIITTKNASCQAIPDGKASALANGGVAPYTYSWNTGSTNDTIFNLAKGNYIVTVMDGTGCKAVKLASVGVPGGGIHFNMRQVQYNNCSLCKAKAKVYDLDGGISPYTFKWSGTGLTTDSAYALCKGSYSVTITDNAGCTASGNINIGGYNGNVLIGRVYNDKNKNCVFDASDEPLKNIIVYGYNTAMTDSNGVYTIYNIPTSNFNLSLGSLSAKWIKYNCPSTGNYPVNFPGTCDTLSNKDFALSFPSNVQDLRTTLYTGTARPGFQQSNTVCYYNYGTKTMNGTVRVTHDSDQVFKSAFPVQASYTYPVLEWVFTNLAPGASGCISFTMETPATKPIGTKLITKAEVFPIIGDTAQENNTAIDTRNVQGSYDPNLKEVQPNGNISPTDTVLKYTIHFQNTGNDTAFNITVRDTLPAYLNPATIKIGASGHFCRTQLFNNVLVFTFPNILLVDSMRNEPKSHGWVNFTIHSKPGIPLNTVIDNEADIYFDFNEPITTNKASNKIVVVGVPVIENSSSDFSIYPNPAADKIYLLYNSSVKTQKVLNMEMFNILGSKVRAQQNIRSGVNEISLEGLGRGLYLLQIKDTESKVVDVERVVVE